MNHKQRPTDIAGQQHRDALKIAASKLDVNRKAPDIKYGTAFELNTGRLSKKKRLARESGYPRQSISSNASSEANGVFWSARSTTKQSTLE